MTQVRDAIAAILDNMTLEQFVATPSLNELTQDEQQEKRATA